MSGTETVEKDVTAEAFARLGDGMDAIVNGMQADAAEEARFEASTALHITDKVEEGSAAAKAAEEAPEGDEAAAAAAAAAAAKPEDKPADEAAAAAAAAAAPTGDEPPAWFKEYMTRTDARLDTLAQVARAPASQEEARRAQEQEQPTRIDALMSAIDTQMEEVEKLAADYPDFKPILDNQLKIMRALGMEAQDARQAVVTVAQRDQTNRQDQVRQGLLAHEELGGWLREAEAGTNTEKFDMAKRFAASVPADKFPTQAERYNEVARLTRIAMGLPDPAAKPEDKPAATIVPGKTAEEIAAAAAAAAKPEDKPAQQQAPGTLDDIATGTAAGGTVAERLAQMDGFDIEAAMMGGQIKTDDFVAFMGRA